MCIRRGFRTLLGGKILARHAWLLQVRGCPEYYIGAPILHLVAIAMAWRNSYVGRQNSYLFSAMSNTQMGSDEEFDEEDIWAVVPTEPNPKREISPRGSRFKTHPLKKGREATPRRLPTASRMIPRNLTPDDNANINRIKHQSAPVNIPDWSKVYKRDAESRRRRNPSIGDDVDEDDEDEKIPPHELIARQLARSQITSFSVCEGAGRTLKGRDLSKVRNAVLTRTGFLE